jgi:YHS domain-containing protein
MMFAAAIALLLAAAFPVIAQEDPLFAPDGVAILGYDPVAYFAEGAAVTGDPEVSLEWNGATWYFSSEANRDLFEADPAQYAPQYGGYCAWAVSRGYTALVDPEQWVVEDGRLFLNFSAGVNRRFTRDLEANIRAADKNWPEVRNQVEN